MSGNFASGKITTYHSTFFYLALDFSYFLNDQIIPQLLKLTTLRELVPFIDHLMEHKSPQLSTFHLMAIFNCALRSSTSVIVAGQITVQFKFSDL